jgi:hypothetical protein
VHPPTAGTPFSDQAWGMLSTTGLP